MKPTDFEFFELLHALLDYDQDTGDLVWLRDWGGAREGEVAGRIRTVRRGKYRYPVRIVGFDFKRYSAHQLIWFWMTGTWPPLIDHRDGNSLNNRWNNLRESTPRLNAQNRRKAHQNNKTGLLGVSQVGSVFKATITVNRRVIRLGAYETGPEAHAAYVTAKRLYHAGCTI